MATRFVPEPWAAFRAAASHPIGRAIDRAELWPILVGLGCATVIQLSLLWDYSWHTTIGRDTFWTPAHLGLYFGGAVPGLVYGALAIHTTMFGSQSVRERSVHFWGFRAPLGGWVGIWGSLAMLAAAPFDSWWHFSYGTDVRIISPPHVLLLSGVTATHLGVLLLIASAANRDPASGSRVVARLQNYGSGMLVLMSGLLGLETTLPIYMHSPMFYLTVAASFPLWLVGAGAARSLWPATSAVLWYTAARLLMNWVLPLFPATPRIGPIHFHPTHMVAPGFPLLLVVPAVALDLVAERIRAWRLGRQAVLLGSVFFLAFLAVQWPFAEFMMSPGARNWVFTADNFRFDLLPNSYTAHHRFLSWRHPAVPPWLAIAAAGPVAVVSAQVGLWWRAFLLKVER